MSVDFLKESQGRLWFDPSLSDAGEQLMHVASVLEGEDSSSDVAEAVGHFLIGALRGNNHVERLIAMLSHTQEDVDKGLAELTGEEVQQRIFKGDDPENNPFYREDFIVAKENAIQAAGIILGRQLLASVTDKGTIRSQEQQEKRENKGKKQNKYIRSAKSLARRIKEWAGKKLSVINKKTVQSMIQDA